MYSFKYIYQKIGEFENKRAKTFPQALGKATDKQKEIRNEDGRIC